MRNWLDQRGQVGTMGEFEVYWNEIGPDGQLVSASNSVFSSS